GIKASHAIEFIGQLVEAGRLEFQPEAKGLKVAYHDPCDIGRHMGIYEPPRKLLAALPGVELVEFPLNRNLAKCCGGGGGMKGFDLELSLELAEQRVGQAAELGVEAIVSACPSCKSNLTQGAARLKRAGQLEKKMKVFDLTELVAARLA
ncbi:MAG: (Fe-S)-binding protein, partial [Deltaproteobacteria bacterium]|nr:(Fe-S)-binding protein [Deltaproteobacteria bacterium]